MFYTTRFNQDDERIWIGHLDDGEGAEFSTTEIMTFLEGLDQKGKTIHEFEKDQDLIAEFYQLNF
jgi:hypothetical protein